MTPEQREAKRARWRRWYEAHRNYRRSPAAQHALTCKFCEKEFVSSKPDAKFCSRDCRVASWRNNGVRIITAKQVRKEEGLDRPKTPHVCHFYPPAFRCLCGKRQSVQTPVMQAGD